MSRRVALAAGLATIILGLARPAPADDNWPQFRGPQGAGMSDKKPGPVDFGPGKNEFWKIPVPSGLASPCVWGQHIYITACDADRKKLETICIDRDDGRIVWRKSLTVEQLEDVHKTSSPASATPTCDGERVYVYFGSFGLIAYNLDGTKAWELPLPMPHVMFGSGASPIIAGDFVVLNRQESPNFSFPPTKNKAKAEGEKSVSEILAVDRKTGQVKWRKPMVLTMGGRSHATPAFAPNNQIVIAAGGRVSGLDAKDGQVKWWVDQLPAVATATPLIVGDHLYVNCTGLAGDTDPVPKIVFADALKQWDKNNDGKLQRDELPDDLALLTRYREDREGDFSVKMFFFRSADKDRDGGLSAEEWDAMYKDIVSMWTQRMKPATVALRLGGEGNVTKTHVNWTINKGVPEVPSMLAVGPNLYAIRNGGLLTCLAADTGKIRYEERLGASGSYYASPISDGDHVYLISQPGVITVIRAGDKFERLARIDLKEEVGATPALVGGRLYVRTAKHLMAFGNAK